jgi:hypothetical protein
MNNAQKARQIRQDLYNEFPEADFDVKVDGDDIAVCFVGGYNYINEYPTHEQAIEKMTEIIRRTFPHYGWDAYVTTDGKEVRK